MILSHHGMNAMQRKKYKTVAFELFGGAPYYTGRFSDVDFDGSLISKVHSSGNGVYLYFTHNGSSIQSKNFTLEFDRVCYSPSNGSVACNVSLWTPFVRTLRGFHRYRDNVGNKNQVVAAYGSDSGWIEISPAYKVNVASMGESPFIITDDPLYNTLYRFKIVGTNGSKIEVFVDGVKLAEKDTQFTEVSYLLFSNEQNFPVGGRNIKLTYEE